MTIIVAKYFLFVFIYVNTHTHRYRVSSVLERGSLSPTPDTHTDWCHVLAALEISPSQNLQPGVLLKFLRMP